MKRPVSLARGLVGRWIHQKQKKAPGPSPSDTDPGKQRNVLAHLVNTLVGVFVGPVALEATWLTAALAPHAGTREPKAGEQPGTS